MTKYEELIKENLQAAEASHWDELEERLPATREGGEYVFRAFGEDCRLGPGSISLSGSSETGPKGLILSLYARHAGTAPMALEPFRSYKDLPGTMPYHGAFAANSERVLIPFVPRIQAHQKHIRDTLDGIPAGPSEIRGDFSFLLLPLPKIALKYIFYLPDDEFPASATCLLSSNAPDFIPLDALADVAEYTSKKIIALVKEQPSF
jgi:hypothetical protein